MFLIARNTLRGVFSRYALYLWGAAVLLMLLRASSAIFMEGGDAMVAVYRTRAVTSALDLWSTLCIASAIFIGAGTIASEVASKTLITVLARPIARWEVLIGRWLGVTAFALVSLALGVVIGVGIAAYGGIDLNLQVLRLSIAHTAAAVALYGACAVALSSVGPSALAAAFTVLLVFLPAIVSVLEEDPSAARRAAGRALDFATPDAFVGHYEALARTSVDYAAERSRLLESAAHGAAYLMLGCVFFSRRDIKL